jgi:hypothetical protein
VLLPAVRDATKDTLIITDGFSCREQIAQATDRKAVHLAEVIQVALGEQSVSGEYPEQRYFANGNSATLSKVEAALLIGIGALFGTGIVWGLKQATGDRQ